ncbi:hypothetical protein AWM75_08215 [Aerococcus urinaehominis]|uniref:Uncharacterized protein n=1 Tax=Aerococcus urinaehominis TaxID=128944 RepID=A0A109RIB4_9LACT|nr:hypothetical protein [Aerococcus urinaehominis]AMB99955.1 hypothetical protein AWM75_08215 [Aerococcus urinaehominis]SDM44420.1 hypothetical protein SAMN04487985_1173 [Aerococcus urinaehominis]
MKTRVTRYLSDYDKEAGYNISWGSIFAGVVSFFAIFVTLSTISAAIGLGVVDFTTANPFSGVGTGMGIWSVIVLILSFAGAGFVSGIAARRVGALHGFVTWASSITIIFVLLGMLLSSVATLAGNVASSAANVAGNAVSQAANSAGNAVESAYNNIANDIQNVDDQQLQADVNQILRDTDVPELQPEYINNQLQAARDEIVAAGREIVVNPENADAIIQNTTDSLANRVETISNAADRDAISSAVATNTELTPAEADQAVNNIYNGLQEASDQATVALNNASQAIQDAKVQVDQTVDQVEQSATQATNTGAAGSVWAFVGLLLSAIIAAGSGYAGVKLTHDPENQA